MNAPAPEPKARHLKDLETQTGPGPALIRHGQRFLLGCLNQEAAEAWTTALGLALQETGALDTALLRICSAYLRNADALGGPPGGNRVVNDQRSEA